MGKSTAKMGKSTAKTGKSTARMDKSIVKICYSVSQMDKSIVKICYSVSQMSKSMPDTGKTACRQAGVRVFSFKSAFCLAGCPASGGWGGQQDEVFNDALAFFHFEGRCCLALETIA